MRSKIIEQHKKKLKLNQKQRSIIIGMLLGDGHLETLNNGRTYRLKVEHSIKQKEYVKWLYEQFKDFTHQEPQARIKNLKGKEFLSYGFTTYSIGLFRFYAQQFYVDKKKIMPKIIKKLLDPLSLAIWFMDDGSWKSNKHRTYIIHTLGYTKKELVLVKEVIEQKFGIIVGIHKQYNKWRLYVYSDSAKQFKNLIESYVIPSMKYKLG
ncbi:MAG TPA: hypothetical protein ENH26_02315 [Candidatus Wolfebacteria bacterium]|nr:hypothetical protein [Candidatus Wolfebacteria bacterium]